MDCRVVSESRGGGKVYTLHDDATGASASILPSYGFNLFDLRLPAAGQVRAFVAAAPGWADRPRDPARNGTPILFPFPNRIRSGLFTYGGRSYRLPIGSAPNAIHGFALDAPWEVIEEHGGPNEAALTGRYQISRHSPRMRSSWPADAMLDVRYALSGRRLTMTTTVTNPTAEELPYGFGIHPYFRLPFEAGGDPEATRVVVPAAKFWVLDNLLPTGERRSVDARLDFRKGQPRKGLKLDDVLTDLEFDGDRSVCRLIDLKRKAEFRLSFDRNFRELVMYTPPREDDVISLEPYTQTTDAINLAAKEIDGGLRRLGHDQREVLTIVMETAG